MVITVDRHTKRLGFSHAVSTPSLQEAADEEIQRSSDEQPELQLTDQPLARMQGRDQMVATISQKLEREIGDDTIPRPDDNNRCLKKGMGAVCRDSITQGL